MKKVDEVAGILIYVSLAGIVVGLFLLLLGTTVWSLIFGV